MRICGDALPHRAAPTAVLHGCRWLRSACEDEPATRPTVRRSLITVAQSASSPEPLQFFFFFYVFNSFRSAKDAEDARAKAEREVSSISRFCKKDSARLQQIHLTVLASHHSAILLSQGKLKPVDLDNPPFDSNCITPGTPFMFRLQQHLQYFVQAKLDTDPSWRVRLPCLSAAG